jgi:hypothetical protein
LSENAFFPELRKRVLAKFLPPVEEENTVSEVISEVSFEIKQILNILKIFLKNFLMNCSNY